MKNPLEIEMLHERYDAAFAIVANTTHQMKVWLSENWGKVDWSDLEIFIYNNNTTHNKNKNKSKWFGPEFQMSGHILFPDNKVKSFSLVLDEIDDDLSVTINDEEFWWINSNDVCSLYRYAINNGN